MELDLTDLLTREIRFLNRLENLKGDIQSRYDYSNYAAFKTIDRYGDAFINTDNVKFFFKQHYVYLTDREALAIIRRIDTDGDAKISYSEFADFMRTLTPSYRPIEYDNSNRDRQRAMSANKRHSDFDVREENATPLK
jgi:hypothetical protein